MREEWRDVPNFEGWYQVSNLGRVRSLTRTFANASGVKRVYKGRLLKPQGYPYLHITFCKQGFQEKIRIHRLVADVFLPNKNGLEYVDHIDCDKTNNRVDNLRWCTHAENIGWATENGLMRGVPYAERSPEAREKQAAARRKPVIRSDGKWYQSTTAAAKDTGVSRSAVSHALCGLVETCGGYRFKYADAVDAERGECFNGGGA